MLKLAFLRGLVVVGVCSENGVHAANRSNGFRTLDRLACCVVGAARDYRNTSSSNTNNDTDDIERLAITE
jgi:aspartate oxidase